MFVSEWYIGAYIDGLVQERRNSIANALELRLSCTNPSISTFVCWIYFRKHEIIVAFPIIARYGTVSWNSSSWKTTIHLSCLVNTIAVDVLAPYVAKASAAIVHVLPWFSRNVPISAAEGLGMRMKCTA